MARFVKEDSNARLKAVARARNLLRGKGYRVSYTDARDLVLELEPLLRPVYPEALTHASSEPQD